MGTPEDYVVNICGHEIRLACTPEEKIQVDEAADMIRQRMDNLQKRSAATLPFKLALMVAFDIAFELTEADKMLKDAEKLHHELQRQKDAVKRLESLLTRVDDALA